MGFAESRSRDGPVAQTGDDEDAPVELTGRGVYEDPEEDPVGRGGRGPRRSSGGSCITGRFSSGRKPVVAFWNDISGFLFASRSGARGEFVDDCCFIMVRMSPSQACSRETRRAFGFSFSVILS